MTKLNQKLSELNRSSWNIRSAQPAVLLPATNIIGQLGTTTFTDTPAVGSGPFFYRVGVQP